ncbi:hypothetical protein Bca4012_076509 [Brassica carinata]
MGNLTQKHSLTFSCNHSLPKRHSQHKSSRETLKGTTSHPKKINVILSRISDGSWSPVCYRTRLAKIRAKDARSVLTCGGEFNSRQIVSRFGPKALDDPKSSTRPQVRRDHPLSLSISISGGKETNKDSLSNGERTGKSPARKSDVFGVRIVVWRSVLSDGPGPSSLERGAREGESPVVPGPCRTTRRCLRVGLFGNAAPIGR